MQICVQDAFVTNFSRLTCYDTVSWYDTTLISFLATSAFCIHVVHDTSYDTFIVKYKHVYKNPSLSGLIPNLCYDAASRAETGGPAGALAPPKIQYLLICPCFFSLKLKFFCALAPSIAEICALDPLINISCLRPWQRELPFKASIVYRPRSLEASAH
jgi:hypothetical protein